MATTERDPNSRDAHWPSSRQHEWHKGHCKACGVMHSVWYNYPCGSHPWTLMTPAGQIVAGVTEAGGLWPLEWPDTLDEDRAAAAMTAFFHLHRSELLEALGKPVKSGGTE